MRCIVCDLCDLVTEDVNHKFLVNSKCKTIRRPSNPKITKLLSCSQHNIKTPKTCYSSQSETGGEKGSELTTQ